MAEASLASTDRLIKPIGDAVLLASTSPAAGLDLVERILIAASELEGFPLARAGLHHGPAVERSGDMFGAAVNLAARVAGQAAGGQTLVTVAVAVADAATHSGRKVVPVGCIGLRNVSEPQELFEVRLGRPRDAGSVDPVCRMWVDHGSAVGRFRYEEREFWFCSLECGRRFAAAPEQYVTNTRAQGPT